MVRKMKELQNWCIAQHRDTNHMYDKYLPYEFHLRMVVEVFKKFKHLLSVDMYKTSYEEYRGMWRSIDITNEIIEVACWGHDLIEDARITYNDCRKNLSIGYYPTDNPAEIIRAVTNYSRGRDRDERMPDYVYEDIRNTPGADFVKLCDRIANVQYGKMMGSSMFKKYQEENEHFFLKLGYKDNHPLREMFDYLFNLLFETKN